MIERKKIEGRVAMGGNKVIYFLRNWCSVKKHESSRILKIYEKQNKALFLITF